MLAGVSAMKYVYSTRILSLAEGTNLTNNDLTTQVIKNNCFLLDQKKKAKDVADILTRTNDARQR